MSKNSERTERMTAIRIRLEEFKKDRNRPYAYYPDEIPAVRRLEANAAEDIEFLLGEIDSPVKLYHIVEFHADGGQMCAWKRRTFEDPELARQFVERMRSESGHTCIPESIKTYKSDVDLGNYQ